MSSRRELLNFIICTACLVVYILTLNRLVNIDPVSLAFGMMIMMLNFTSRDTVIDIIKTYFNNKNGRG